MKISDIMEAPIEDLQLIGDFNRSSSFNKQADRRLLTNPIYVQRVKNMFAKTNIDFRMFFINSPEANRIGVEQGPVTLEWVQQNMPKTLEAINQQGGFGQQSLNMMYGSNKGIEWRPMTGWIMAHRMGHVVLRTQTGNKVEVLDMIEREAGDQLRSIFRSYSTELPDRDPGNYRRFRMFGFYPNQHVNVVTRFLNQIGTMRSARDGTARTPFEFLCECFAQYLINGEIKFKPPPEMIVAKFYGGRPSYRRIYGPVDLSSVEDSLQYIATTLQQEFDIALHSGVGKIYLM